MTPLNITRRPVAGPMHRHVKVTACNGCPDLGAATLNGREVFVCRHDSIFQTNEVGKPIDETFGDYILTPCLCPAKGEKK